MKNTTEKKESGFAERFSRFLEVHHLNPNSLAVAMAGDADGEEVKKMAVRFRRWSKGEANPSYEGMVEIAVAYNISMDWLTMGVGSMKRGQPQTAGDQEPEQAQPVSAPGPVSQPDNIELIKLQMDNEHKQDVINAQQARIDELEREKKQLQDDFRAKDRAMMRVLSKNTGIDLAADFKKSSRTPRAIKQTVSNLQYWGALERADRTTANA